jgi:predicted ATP-binding protein involved in virulence
MKVTQLELTNFRAYENLKIEFENDLTVIAGVNGVGKSTALEAIARLLSQKLPELTYSKEKPLYFETSDIRFNTNFFQIKLDYKMSDNKLFDVLNFNDKKEKVDFALLKISPDKNKIKTKYNDLAVYYNVNRASLVIPRTKGKEPMMSKKAAYERALNGDRIDLKDFIALYNYQKEEGIDRKHINKTIENAIYSLMPEFSKLKILSDPNPIMLLEKNGGLLNVSAMSDGERNVLAMTIDLARRLAIANPESKNPLREGKAVVLIDEIELHLHPKWQRTILSLLIKTFQNCQFIVTTHSPQVLGEVEAKCIRYLYRDKQTSKVMIKKTKISKGYDSAEILEFIMGVPRRNAETSRQLDNIFDLINNENFEESKKLIQELKNYLNGDLPEIVRAESLINMLDTDLIDDIAESKE